MTYNKLLTASYPERAALFVHGEVLKVHDAGGSDGQPLRVQNPSVGEQSTINTKWLNVYRMLF